VAKSNSEKVTEKEAGDGNDHLRFYRRHEHLFPVFGNDWFALKAERLARFFGTPVFLFSQTAIVIVWILINEIGLTHFDVYPFILLNLAFSLQAAYAAPLILLAETRQADRDSAHAEADALHREELAQESVLRANYASKQTEIVLGLLQKNTELTEIIRTLSTHIESLTAEIHQTVSGKQAEKGIRQEPNNSLEAAGLDGPQPQLKR
jgi:uncharacterized membrane protein